MMRWTRIGKGLCARSCEVCLPAAVVVSLATAVAAAPEAHTNTAMEPKTLASQPPRLLWHNNKKRAIVPVVGRGTVGVVPVVAPMPASRGASARTYNHRHARTSSQSLSPVSTGHGASGRRKGWMWWRGGTYGRGGVPRPCPAAAGTPASAAPPSTAAPVWTHHTAQ